MKNRKDDGEDVLPQLMAIAKEMHRQKLGRIKAGPTADGHLYFDISVREATPREVARHRCKKMYTRGGRKFQCTLMGKHESRPCVIKTARSGYQIMYGERE